MSDSDSFLKSDIIMQLVGNLTFNGHSFSWRKFGLLCTGCNEVSFELIARVAFYCRRFSGNQCIVAVFVR